MSTVEKLDNAEVDGAPDDELNTPFKRRVALAVTLVALAGGILAYLSSDAGARESTTDRAAEQAAVAALASQNNASNELAEQFSAYVNASMLQRRHDVAVIGAQLLGQDAVDGGAADWRAVQDELDDLTPLLGTGEVAGRPDLLAVHLATAPDRATLQEQALQATAGSWGDKANLYVGGVTLLAVAITLLGLALTVGVGIRRLFVVPAVALVAVTVVGSVVLVLRPPAGTPQEAIEAVVEGDRLAASRDFAAAVEQFSRAIAIDPDYATAYARRATAELLAGSPEAATSTYVVSTASREARLASIVDLNRALALGGEDYATLVNQGANLLHLPAYARSEGFSRRAIELNADLPLPWMNLGLALVGQGRQDEARAAYQHTIELVAQRPTLLERGELFASARGTLAMVALQEPRSAALVAQLQAELVRAEGEAFLPDGVAAPRASVSSLQVNASHSILRATLEYADIPRSARVAWIVYYRLDSDSEWLQRTDLSLYENSAVSQSGTAYKDIFDGTCPQGGQYRVDMYADGRLLASTTAPAEPSTLELTAYADPVGGIWLCRPSDWSLRAEMMGSATLTSPDGGRRLVVRTVPVLSPPEGVAARSALVDDVLERLRRELSVDAVVTGTSQDLFFPVASPARQLRIDAATDGYVWAYLGPDNVLRTVSASYPTGDAGDLVELAARARF